MPSAIQTGSRAAVPKNSPRVIRPPRTAAPRMPIGPHRPALPANAHRDQPDPGQHGDQQPRAARPVHEQQPERRRRRACHDPADRGGRSRPDAVAASHPDRAARPRSGRGPRVGAPPIQAATSVATAVGTGPAVQGLRPHPQQQHGGRPDRTRREPSAVSRCSQPSSPSAATATVRPARPPHQPEEPVPAVRPVRVLAQPAPPPPRRRSRPPAPAPVPRRQRVPQLVAQHDRGDDGDRATQVAEHLAEHRTATPGRAGTGGCAGSASAATRSACSGVITPAATALASVSRTEAPVPASCSLTAGLLPGVVSGEPCSSTAQHARSAHPTSSVDPNTVRASTAACASAALASGKVLADHRGELAAGRGVQARGDQLHPARRVELGVPMPKWVIRGGRSAGSMAVNEPRGSRATTSGRRRRVTRPRPPRAVRRRCRGQTSAPRGKRRSRFGEPVRRSVSTTRTRWLRGSARSSPGPGQRQDVAGASPGQLDRHQTQPAAGPTTSTVSSGPTRRASNGQCGGASWTRAAARLEAHPPPAPHHLLDGTTTRSA